MNQSQLNQLRMAVDFQIASLQSIALLSHELGTSPADVLEVVNAMAMVHEHGADISRQEVVGTLNHIRRVRRECTPPTMGLYQGE